jgi:hypothetical protein
MAFAFFGNVGLTLACLFPLAALGVSLLQMILLGPQATQSGVLARRVWIFFGKSAAFVCAATLAAMVFFGSMAAVGNDFPDLTTSGRILFLATYFAWFALLFYCVSRLGLVFPATAVDEPLSPASSWRLTKGNGLRLATAFTGVILVLVLIGIACKMALAAGPELVEWLYINVVPVEYHYWPGGFVRRLPTLVLGSLLSCVATALLAGTFAAAYACISGWGLPRQDILERFE